MKMIIVNESCANAELGKIHNEKSPKNNFIFNRICQIIHYGLCTTPLKKEYLLELCIS